MRLGWKVLVTVVAWSVVMGLVLLTKHPHISMILPTTSGDLRYPPPPDDGAPQLVVWMVGVALIAIVALLARMRARRPRQDSGG
ncbi:MAG: hypothetical protein QOF11_1624 [Chloroflexota bacterium]|jgi:hypothetical protein|nr:hypothetical protein [Chloroflexota bacterium]